MFTFSFPAMSVTVTAVEINSHLLSYLTPPTESHRCQVTVTVVEINSHLLSYLTPPTETIHRTVINFLSLRCALRCTKAAILIHATVCSILWRTGSFFS
ncbi:hypothetical protein F2Q70_00027380 [Brassica cretica]|uniref:Uncharacterized protein n=1 Tax=Brassica cretica TaxID=69181 RepID=A0A8S9L4T1_BRACR|nr:hypothetical protein F2Q70_00027380 [Brassica cretica]